MMTKSAARALARQQRALMTEDQIQFLSEKMFRQLDPSWIAHPRHHLFWPITGKKEVHTPPLAHLLAETAQVFLPRVAEEGQLTHHRWHPGDSLACNAWGIWEPTGEGISTTAFWQESLPTVVWIPLLAFDRAGYRVGYGKGFYDQFLQQASHVWKVGLSLLGPLENELDADPWDIPLDACATPDQIWIF